MSALLLKRAFNALENSLDAVQQEYDTDWRHGLPSRKRSMDGMLELLNEHKAVIELLREELKKPEPVECG